MGKETRTRLNIFGCLLLFCLIPVYLLNVGGNSEGGEGQLQFHFTNIEGYDIYERRMDRAIVRTLDLDDFASLSFLVDGSVIELFVGHYNNLETLSAAHSPQVCFLSQGWEIGESVKGIFETSQGKIHYIQLVASKENNKQLVIYWYQAYRLTSTEIFKNKLDTFYNKIMYNKSSHALIRVTVPFTEGNIGFAKFTAERFIKKFYRQYMLFLDI